jgi:flavodoxin I
MSGKRIALFGLGNQRKYYDHLYHDVRACGAEVIGYWSTDGYHFTRLHSVIDNRCVGLILDHHNHPEMTKARIITWLEQIKPSLVEKLGHT